MARRLPFIFMRGGTSRGGYFLKQHLPADDKAIERVLLAIYGTVQPPRCDDNFCEKVMDAKNRATELHSMDYFAGQSIVSQLPTCTKQVSGIGGATSVTSKVAIISKSEELGIDIDYRFAQVSHNKNSVDFEPSCGNILAGVGPAAIEMGLIDKDKIGQEKTLVRIRAINNNSLVEALIDTPSGEVTYEGNAAIDGVGGTAAPVTLNFMNVVGSKSGGQLLPTGNVRDKFEGIEVTCIDVAMPMVIAKASSFGKSGYETKAELDADKDFFMKLEAVRKSAGRAMGLGDVTGRVIPKFAIVAKPQEDMIFKVDASVTARYFVPDNTHAAMAVTGAICLGSCSILEGSVAFDVSRQTMEGDKNKVVIAHPSGSIQVILETEQKEGEVGMVVKSAGVLRTARLISAGFLRLPSHWWDLSSALEGTTPPRSIKKQPTSATADVKVGGHGTMADLMFTVHTSAPNPDSPSPDFRTACDKVYEEFQNLFRLSDSPAGTDKRNPHEDSVPQKNGSASPMAPWHRTRRL